MTAPPGRASAAQLARLAGRTCARYPVPLLALAVAALAPWILLAIAAPAPASRQAASGALRDAWLLGATAWIGQLLLVGATAPLVRALDAGAPPSQLRALGRGALGLLRAAVPWLAAVVAIAIGALALALPGLALLVLLSATAASEAPGLPGPLLESAARLRRALPVAVGAVAALLAIDLGAVAIAQALLRPEAVAGKLRPEQLAALGGVPRIAALAAVAVAPPIAALLAAAHARATRDGSRRDTISAGDAAPPGRRAQPAAAGTPQRARAARTSSAVFAQATRGSSMGAARRPYQTARQPAPSAPSTSAGQESPMWMPLDRPVTASA